MVARKFCLFKEKTPAYYSQTKIKVSYLIRIASQTAKYTDDNCEFFS